MTKKISKLRGIYLLPARVYVEFVLVKDLKFSLVTAVSATMGRPVGQNVRINQLSTQHKYIIFSF